MHNFIQFTIFANILLLKSVYVINLQEETKTKKEAVEKYIDDHPHTHHPSPKIGEDYGIHTTVMGYGSKDTVVLFAIKVDK